jgi:hypothetical protein
MAAFRPFEIEAIRLMAEGVLSPAQLELLAQLAEPLRYEYTGCGYFLTVAHASLLSHRCTLSQPAVVGTAGEVQAGFVVFLAENELTLECHTWGALDVPEDFRDRSVEISALPINVVDLRDAT